MLIEFRRLAIAHFDHGRLIVITYEIITSSHRDLYVITCKFIPETLQKLTAGVYIYGLPIC